MDVREIFLTANQEYKEIQNLIIKLGSVLENADHENYSVENSLLDFDLILQCVLLRAAAMDGIFCHIEGEFIKAITTKGDVLELLAHEGILNCSWETLELLNKQHLMTIADTVENSVHKYASRFILPFAAVDGMIVEKDFLDEIDNRMINILTCLAKIDGDYNDFEVKAGCKQYSDIMRSEWLAIKQRSEKHFESKKETESSASTLKDLYLKKKILNNDSCNLINYCKNKSNITKAIIYIETEHGSGSGFIITEDGYAVTCAHVVNGAHEIYVKINKENNDFDVIRAELFSIDRDLDIAIIKLEDASFNYTELDLTRNQPDLGEEIVIYGYPFGKRMNDNVQNLNISFAKGYVSSNQVESGMRKTFLDISAKSGNSGSPIISAENGKVIGILAGSILEGQQHVEEINYMIPIDYINKFFED